MRIAPRRYRVQAQITKPVVLDVTAWNREEAERIALATIERETLNDVLIQDVEQYATCNQCGALVNADEPICPEHGPLDRGDQW